MRFEVTGIPLGGVGGGVVRSAPCPCSTKGGKYINFEFTPTNKMRFGFGEPNPCMQQACVKKTYNKYASLAQYN